MNKLAKHLQQHFTDDPNVELAFLFGSSATGKATKDSDIDVAVYLKDRKKETASWRGVQQIVQREVDFILLNDAPATLASNIFKTGIPLTIKNKKLYLRLFLNKSLEAEDFEEFALSYWKILKRSRSLSPEDRTRLLERLDFLESEMQELPDMKEVSISEYEEDTHKRRNLERWVENILNALIDIAKITLASERKEMPKTYEAALSAFGTFVGLSSTERETLAGFARLRNLLAHQYLEILFGKIQEFIADFPKLHKKILPAVEVLLRKSK